MIEKLIIKNYKSLHQVKINLKGLNLFLGLNSMGKSSAVQSLLLLRQSYIKNGSLHKLLINGDLVSLGNSRDIYYSNGDIDGQIEFRLENGDDFLDLKYQYTDGESILLGNTNMKEPGSISNFSLFGKGFCYLAADHIQPSKTYSSSGALDSYDYLGKNGQNAPYYLAKHGSEVIKNALLHHPNAKSDTLSHELDAWMGEVSPGTRLIAEEQPGLDLVTLSVQYKANVYGKEEYTEKVSPVNVGFGIPYVMPVILALLTSKSGDLVIIENPESHLHPRGQAQLGRLMALAAQSGVQVICETHSDHVINGVRVAVKDNEIDHSNLGFYYFEKDRNVTLDTVVTPIRIDKNGELDKYPDGLLDEWGNLMGKLF